MFVTGLLLSAFATSSVFQTLRGQDETNMLAGNDIKVLQPVDAVLFLMGGEPPFTQAAPLSHVSAKLRS